MATPKRSLAAQKSVRIRRAIRNKLATGELSTGDQLPAERKLAANFQVSRTTVRIAMDDLVEEGVLERHHGSGTYVTDQTKNLHRTRRTTHLVCHSVHEDLGANNFLSEVFSGLTSMLASSEQSLVVTNISADCRFNEHPRFQDIISHPSSVVYAAYTPNPQEVEQLIKTRTPAVIIGPEHSDAQGQLPTIEFDMEQGTFDATSAILRMGHERVVLANGPETLSCCQQIEKGYRRAFDSRGLDVQKELLIDTVGWELEAGREAMRRLLESGTDFTAVLSYGDWSTFGMLDPLIRSGYTPGRDLAFAMIDYYSWLARVMPVAISAVAMDRARLAREALEILDLQNDGVARPELSRRVPTKFVEQISSRVGGPALIVDAND